MVAARNHKWVAGAGVLLWIIFLIGHIAVVQGRKIISLDYFSRLHEPHDLGQENIVLVSITNDDIKNDGHGDQPILKEGRLDPTLIIKAVKIIASANPAAIAVDVDTTNPQYVGLCDTPFTAESSGTRRSVPVVWARAAEGPNPGIQPDSPVAPSPFLGGITVPPTPCAAGISNIFLDGNSIRRYKWKYQLKDGGVADSFALAVLRAVCEVHNSQDNSFSHNCGYSDSWRKTCDSDNDNGFCLRPAFMWFSMSNHHQNIAFGTLFKLSSDTSPALKSMLQGKIVFVGAESYPGQAHLSVEGPLYDVRIHAEALAAALQHKGIIWVRSPWFLMFLELAAFFVLYLIQHWIRRQGWRIAVIFIGAILLSASLSSMAFATPVFLVNFPPLLGGVFVDLILAKPRTTPAVFPGNGKQQPVSAKEAQFKASSASTNPGPASQMDSLASPNEAILLWQEELQRKRDLGQFDVFLCHNTADKPAVKQIARELQKAGVLPWLDEWELRPGQPWQEKLEQQIATIKAAAVFGSSGIGPWQEQEMRGFLEEFARRKATIIPVILPEARSTPELPIFLRAMTWVDFRVDGQYPLQRLIWGITGKRPGDSAMDA